MPARPSVVRFNGAAGASFLSDLGLDAGAKVSAFFPGRPDGSAWYVRTSGAFGVRGVRLAGEAQAELGPSGVSVKGDLATPISQVKMAGSIGKSGIDLRGQAKVSIPVAGDKVVIQQIADG